MNPFSLHQWSSSLPGRGSQVPRPGPPRAESGGCLGHAGGDLRRKWGDFLGILLGRMDENGPFVDDL